MLFYISIAMNYHKVTDYPIKKIIINNKIIINFCHCFNLVHVRSSSFAWFGCTDMSYGISVMSHNHYTSVIVNFDQL